MPVTEKVIPYDLLNSEEAFYWSCVCRSAIFHLCRVDYVLDNVWVWVWVSGTFTAWGTREMNTWRRWFQLYRSSVSMCSGELKNCINKWNSYLLPLLQLCREDFAASRRGGGKDAETVHLSTAALPILYCGPL